MPNITLVSRPCPICDKSDQSRLFAEANFDTKALDEFAFASRKLPEYMHWRFMQCGRCDLIYADPAPPLNELSTLYRDAAFDSGEEARIASQTYASFLPEILRNLPGRDGAVDIGTGDGAFLHELLAGSGDCRQAGVQCAGDLAVAPALSGFPYVGLQ